MINYKTYRLFACNRISTCLWNLPFFIGLSLIVGACATGPTTKTPKVTTTAPALSGKETLLTIESTPVAVEEFLYVYNKNNNDSIQYSTEEERDKALRDYLDLFINFKLKVKAAKAEGLDQSQGFKKELARYQKQLAKPYLIENQVTEQLVQEAYARLQQEVHASHILIEVAEDASPADTLKAYRTIDSLRNLAQHGDAQQNVPFDKLARENSGDPSAAMNGGDLGYFTALQMVYPFENAAYNTPVGQISLPVRSQFGYHIVKVHDRRPARGKVKVAHIMLRLAPNATPEEETKISDKAVEIYQQLQKGGNWNELCERFSEDVSTKSSGGSLPYFGTGSMLGAFEEAAFALNNKGDISEPVRTQFGWHILKLEDKKPVDSLEKLRPELERKIAQSVRSEVLRKDMVSKLKKENNFQADPQIVQSLLQGPSGNEVNTTIANPETTLFTLNDTAYTVGSFYRYAEGQEGNHQDGNSDMAKLYNSFVEEQVLAYEEAHLAEKHDAYRLLLNEYYDGILLFEMMEKEVWAKATKDTVGLQNFFDTHKTQYQWKERVEATLFEVPNEGVVSQLQKSITGKKFPLDEDTQKGIEDSFTEKGTSIGIFYGTYEKGQTRYTTAEKVIDKVNWTKGETQITANGKVYLIKIHEVLPPGPKKLSEIRGIVIADYQNHLEKEWVDSLKQVYVINVNEDVLQKVIQSLQ
jgi:peptidyl-prolyl cis-trans isomerase SurA